MPYLHELKEHQERSRLHGGQIEQEVQDEDIEQEMQDGQLEQEDQDIEDQSVVGSDGSSNIEGTA